MFPEEERVQYSAMTGQSLYYLGETDLKHKILAIVEEEGAEKASYALKLLQSEGELTIASTGKDPTTGRMETQEYHVEGPVMIFLTTTAIDIDEELQNRCLTLTVDESREQTERIHALAAQGPDPRRPGRAGEARKTCLRVLRNAQRLLQPLAVVNDYAERLTFVSERTRTRRDHEKYLSLIDAVDAACTSISGPSRRDAVNGRGVPYIRATLDDIALANRLAPELLGRSLDELPPQTRRLLSARQGPGRGSRCKKRDVEQSLALFSRRDLAALCGWSYSQVKRHLIRLQELDYIAPRFGRMGATLQLRTADRRRRTGGDRPYRLAGRGEAPATTAKPTTTTRTGPGTVGRPPCQTDGKVIARTAAETSVNLATLPARTSGAGLPSSYA